MNTSVATRRPSLFLLLSALPETTAAMYFLLLWIVPGWLGEGALRVGFLIVNLEFFALMAAGFIGTVVIGSAWPAVTRVVAILLIAAMCLLFVVNASLIHDAWWPIAVFAWLIVGKIALTLDTRIAAKERSERQAVVWMFGGASLVVAFVLVLVLPLPELGLTADVVLLPLEIRGNLFEQPEAVAALGLFHFTLLACARISCVLLDRYLASP